MAGGISHKAGKRINLPVCPKWWEQVGHEERQNSGVNMKTRAKYHAERHRITQERF